MRLPEPDRTPNEDDIASLNDEVVRQGIHETFPEAYWSLSTRHERRLFDTVRQYIAHRQKLKPRGKESRTQARIAAKKRVAAERDLHQQSIDNILQDLYDSDVRSPNECFETQLELVNLYYSRIEKDWITEVDEQFYRLQNVLLELAEIEPPELSPAELTATDFIDETRPESYSELYTEEDWEERVATKERLLDAGKDAMEESAESFLLQDVTQTDTEFGRTWRKAKEIVGEYLTIEKEIDHIDSLYVTNDLDNVRFHAHGPDRGMDEALVRVDLEYYPTGLLEVKSRSYGIIGEESLSRRWFAGTHEWGEHYPLERHHIRGYIDDLLSFISLAENHIDHNACIDEETPWLPRH